MGLSGLRLCVDSNSLTPLGPIPKQNHTVLFYSNNFTQFCKWLRDRGCGAAAVQFVESLVGRAPRVNAELVALFREMIRSGFTGEATRLIALCIFEQPNEIQPILKDLTDKRLFAEVGYLTKIGVSKHPRLAWHALTIKVAVLAAQDVHLVLLQHYLDQVAFRDRRKLLEE